MGLYTDSYIYMSIVYLFKIEKYVFVHYACRRPRMTITHWRQILTVNFTHFFRCVCVCASFSKWDTFHCRENSPSPHCFVPETRYICQNFRHTHLMNIIKRVASQKRTFIMFKYIVSGAALREKNRATNNHSFLSRQLLDHAQIQ